MTELICFECGHPESEHNEGDGCGVGWDDSSRGCECLNCPAVFSARAVARKLYKRALEAEMGNASTVAAYLWASTRANRLLTELRISLEANAEQSARLATQSEFIGQMQAENAVLRSDIELAAEGLHTIKMYGDMPFSGIAKKTLAKMKVATKPTEDETPVDLCLGMDENAVCSCGSKLQIVRPGKYQCEKCG